jgi:hypothetical protein
MPGESVLFPWRPLAGYPSLQEPFADSRIASASPAEAFVRRRQWLRDQLRSRLHSEGGAGVQAAPSFQTI